MAWVYPGAGSSSNMARYLKVKTVLSDGREIESCADAGGEAQCTRAAERINLGY
jgi:hypothetical protein